MIRTILVLIYIVLYLIILIPMMLITYLIGKWRGAKKKDLLSRGLISAGFKGISFLSGVKLDVIGKENIPTEEAVLFVGNHRSFFDIVVSYPLFPSVTGYVAKNDLEQIPVFSFWMKRIHCLFLDREDPRNGMKMILDAIDLINDGISVVIYPEGKRGPDENGNMLPFKEASLKMAQRTDCPVVPMAITHSNEILEDHFPFIRSTHVTISFGKPFRISELPKNQQKKAAAHAQNLIAGMMEQAESS